MGIFKDDTDAIHFAVRKLYHDVLHRELESSAVHQMWVTRWQQAGGDSVLAGIMDSAEGQHRLAQMRALLDQTMVPSPHAGLHPAHPTEKPPPPG